MKRKIILLGSKTWKNHWISLSKTDT